MGNQMQSKTVLNLPLTRLYWKDSNSKLSMGGERTVQRLGKNEIPRRITEGKRRVGKTKLLWMGGVVEHLRKWGNQNAKDRQLLVGVLREAGNLCGL